MKMINKSKIYCYFKQRKLLLLILLTTFLYRIAGINYGFPLFLIIDEPTTVYTAFKFADSLNPGRFDWPSFHFYFYGLFIILTKVFVMLLNAIGITTGFLESDVPYFVISRFVSVCVSTATAWVIYITINKLYKKNIFALLGALLFAFLPIGVYEGHFFRPDIMLMFLTSIYLYHNLNIFLDKNHSTKNYIILGSIMGIAVSSKYNAFLLSVTTVLFWLVFYDKKVEFINYIKKFALAFFTSITVFVLLNPFVIIDFDTFWSDQPSIGLLWQFENLGRVSFSEYVYKFLNVLGPDLISDLSIGVAMLLLLNLFVYLFFNYRSKLSIVLNTSILFFILYIIQYDRSPSHYFIYLLPFYVLAIINFINDYFDSKYYRPGVLRYLLIFTMFAAFVSSTYITAKLIRNDSRAVLYDYLKKNDFSNEKIVVHGDELNILDIKFIKDITKVRTIEAGTLDYEFDFYVIVGSNEVIRNSMLAKIEPNGLREDQFEFYERAQLEKLITSDLRFGPDIYVYKVEGTR